MMLYNYTYEYSLLSYMEYPVLIVQEYILVALVLQYKRMLNQNTIIYICGYFVLMLSFAYQILPRFFIAMLVVSTIALYSYFECCTYMIEPKYCFVSYYYFSHFAHLLGQPAKWFNCWKYCVLKIQQWSALLLGSYQHSQIWVSCICENRNIMLN